MIMSIRVMHHVSDGLSNDAKVLFNTIPNIQIKCYPEADILKETPLCMERVDIHIFLEHLYEYALSFATMTCFIPNMEWLNGKDLRLLTKYPDITIIAKTKYARDILCKRFGPRVRYTGWDSIDMHNNNESKSNQWLHLKGVSPFKHTQAVLNVWMKHPEWPVLHIVAHGDDKKNGFITLAHSVNVTPNIVLYQYKLDHDVLVGMMNRCAYHICPSQVEGFGHYINEGLSTNATVITTDGAPMNELVTDARCLIPCRLSHMMNLGMSFEFSEESLELVLKNVIENDLRCFHSRTEFINRRHSFAHEFKSLIACISITQCV